MLAPSLCHFLLTSSPSILELTPRFVSLASFMAPGKSLWIVALRTIIKILRERVQSGCTLAWRCPPCAVLPQLQQPSCLLCDFTKAAHFLFEAFSPRFLQGRGKPLEYSEVRDVTGIAGSLLTPLAEGRSGTRRAGACIPCLTPGRCLTYCFLPKDRLSCAEDPVTGADAGALLSRGCEGSARALILGRNDLMFAVTKKQQRQRVMGDAGWDGGSRIGSAMGGGRFHLCTGQLESSSSA